MAELFSEKINLLIQQTSEVANKVEELTNRVNELEQHTCQHATNEAANKAGTTSELTNRVDELGARLTKLINEITPVLTSHANVLTELTKRLNG